MDKRTMNELTDYVRSRIEGMEIGGEREALLKGLVSSMEIKYELDVPRWIPVTERLPEKPGCYLVTILNREWVGKEIVQGAKPPKDNLWENHANIYAERSDGKWVAVEKRVFQNDVRPVWSGYDEQVLAWMPLPKPYTEVKSNDNDQ